jgi:hypothetical protein
VQITPRELRTINPVDTWNRFVLASRQWRHDERAEHVVRTIPSVIVDRANRKSTLRLKRRPRDVPWIQLDRGDLFDECVKEQPRDVVNDALARLVLTPTHLRVPCVVT